jgi:hypothetical protein
MNSSQEGFICVLALVIAFCFVASLKAQTTPKTVDQLLDAISIVEQKEPYTGHSKGPFRITYNYWSDSGLADGKWADCENTDYSRRVVMSYWQRHASFALRNKDLKTLARVHKGGPGGDRREATLEFWRKVEVELNRM